MSTLHINAQRLAELAQDLVHTIQQGFDTSAVSIGNVGGVRIELRAASAKLPDDGWQRAIPPPTAHNRCITRATSATSAASTPPKNRLAKTRQARPTQTRQ